MKRIVLVVLSVIFINIFAFAQDLSEDEEGKISKFLSITNDSISCKNYDYIIFAPAITQYNCVRCCLMQKIEIKKSIFARGLKSI